MLKKNSPGYCFGGPFALEVATTDNVVACTLSETSNNTPVMLIPLS
jgi:dienelactone hydrolase